MKSGNFLRASCSLIIFFCILVPTYPQVELRYEENYSVTYEEAILAYQELDQAYPEARLLKYGLTDVGKPLHLFVISSGETFDPESIAKQNKRILFILNGIHPGESCGIDASIEYSREVLERNGDLYQYLENVVLCIVPVYNIGGALNRGAYHRTNQDPPIEAGFRGNARNLDLNRDFIKLDTRNTESFIEIFQSWKPDVFLDNHVTNGSDHQYTVTIAHRTIQKMDPGLGEFFDRIMLPELYSAMRRTPYEMCPYVNTYHRSPEQGIMQAPDPPRFAASYTALFNTLSLLNEIHVYKPFPDQVKATSYLMKELLAFTSKHAGEIAAIREHAIRQTCLLDEYTMKWGLDTTRHEELNFKGYAYKRRTSELTGNARYYYDRNDPWEMTIPYYRYFKPVLTVPIPDYFIIPQVWHEVIRRLELNGIEMVKLKSDTVITVEACYIENIEHPERPYNGHFLHRNIRVRSEQQDIRFFKGDVMIPLNQPGNRYLMETLDPRGSDSFMAWNFFDPILERREYMGYTFEKRAADILKNDPDLRSRFEKRKTEDPEFASSDRAQLHFIYANSPWSEKTYRRYPVYRIFKEAQ